MKISLVSFAIGVLILNVSAAVDEEVLLRAKAALVAKKALVRNLNLIGVSPSSCKSQDDKQLYLDQMKVLKTASLNHCPTLIDSVMKPLNDEIAKIDAGELAYAPVPLPINVPQQNDEPPMEDEVYADMQPQPSFTEVKTNSVPDMTGLSEEEKERIFSTYESNQNAYVSSEDDNLFNIVSKAYVRNLNRLIERDKHPINNK